MSKLTEKEREGFEKIMVEEIVGVAAALETNAAATDLLKAINTKLMNQIKDFWAKAREEVMKNRGWDRLVEEKEKLKQKRNDILPNKSY